MNSDLKTANKCLLCDFNDCSDFAAFRTTYLNESFQGEIQLLKPVSLDLEIKRNLASNWYHDIPDIEITAHLKPLTVSNAIR